MEGIILIVILYWLLYSAANTKPRKPQIGTPGEMLPINSVLHTKDGSKIGNAIVNGWAGLDYIIITDYGNPVILTRDEIASLYKLAPRPDGFETCLHKHHADSVAYEFKNGKLVKIYG